ncbi:uncharacterized protein BO87DRAFT_166650 [Aspergillus neoniger CBS 115656]|uniref:Transmembrane protein n=1 Tax=Aspergillus neoniger (strain CBS 115656) TaxID=1448310 RepID=A0A318Z3J4_ASPNB|nr:hypothetical protein BO87DRAFT_166650 [Aspergillus neoniger CBS 115656]PYH38360.1 hypothetical protein BO87DRAFT_166650 [Aspergillus neoniger CBS 115656]
MKRVLAFAWFLDPQKSCMLSSPRARRLLSGVVCMNPTPFSLLFLLLVCCICAYIMVYSSLLFLCFSFFSFFYVLFSFVLSDDADYGDGRNRT